MPDTEEWSVPSPELSAAQGCRRYFACTAADLPDGAMRRVDIDGAPPIALYNIRGDIYATADRCTHSRASLSEGDLEGDCVVCPVHFGVFHVPSGQAIGRPACKDLSVFPTHVTDGAIFVTVNEREMEGGQ